MTSGAIRRLAAFALTVVVASALTACSLPAGSVSQPPPKHKTATPSPAGPKPASLAGGACLLLDYATINSVLGTEFSVAASADKSDSYTCVVQGSSSSYPDLTLSITATDLTPSDFSSDVKPSKSTTVKDLGKVGYEIERPAGNGIGASIEVGWLSGNERLIILTYVYESGATTESALVDKMIELAKRIDVTTV